MPLPGHRRYEFHLGAPATIASSPVSESGVQLRWSHVARIGLVQAAIGAVVVMMTATLNRVMVVELALPALVPGVLVAAQNGVQFGLRPSMGYGSDVTGRRQWWIIGGMLLLALSGTGAAAATATMATARGWGIAAAFVCFIGIGAGVSAASTPLLAMLSERLDPARRSPAAALVWIMMIAGFIVTTKFASVFLAPFSWERLVHVTAGVAVVAFAVAVAAVWGIEREVAPHVASRAVPRRTGSLAAAAREVWSEPTVRAFCLFLGLGMFAYSAQDLILEPFAGLAFGLSPAESTAASGIHQRGLLAGMLVTAALAPRFGTSASWAAAGCAISALFFVALGASPLSGSALVLKTTLVGLGIGNGIFAIGAVASMMALTADTSDGRAGLRMGVFGAAEAIAMGTGNFLGAAGSDVARAALGTSVKGYAAVFAMEALLFAVAAIFALRSTAASDVRFAQSRARRHPVPVASA